MIDQFLTPPANVNPAPTEFEFVILTLSQVELEFASLISSLLLGDVSPMPTFPAV